MNSVERRGAGPGDQVHVVGHEAVRMEGHAVSHPIHGESVEIGVVVGVAEERRLPLISAGDDVVEEAGGEEPGPASHAC